MEESPEACSFQDALGGLRLCDLPEGFSGYEDYHWPLLGRLEHVVEESRARVPSHNFGRDPSSRIGAVNEC